MKNTKIHILLLLLILSGVSCNEKQQQEPIGLPALKISENKRYLVDKDGNPFFWLGDTGWLLFSKLNREEAETYLANRAEKGFNVIQAMVLHTVGVVNIYGDSALIAKNVSNPKVTEGNSFEDSVQYDFWDNVDYVIKKAEEKGMYVALVPIWGSDVKSGHVSRDGAAEYAAFLANRYKDQSNIIWLNGGDIRGSDATEIWKIIGTTINQIDTNHLITFHPFGRTASSIWFHNEDWLD
ncbi:MAG: DUF4038 domain-containing protein, partial [Bacteroidales bacterium]